MKTCTELPPKFSALAVALAFWGAITTVISSRFLLGDGGPFLLNILSIGGFTTWDFARQHAHYLTQAPVVTALKLGLRPFWALNYLYGIGLASVPVLGLACSWAFLPPHRKRASVWIAVSVAFLQLNTGLFIISESHVMVSCFLALICFLLFCDEVVYNRVHFILAIAIGLVGVRAYESGFFFAPIVSFLCVSRWKRADSALRRVLALILLFQGIAFLIALQFLFFNPSRNVHTVGLGEMLLSLLRDPTFLLSSGLFLVFCATMIFSQISENTGHKVTIKRFALSLLLGMLLGCLPLYSQSFIGALFSYEGRLLNIGIPLGVAAILIVEQRRVLAVPTWGLHAAIVLLIWTATWQATTSYCWWRYTFALDRSAQVATSSILPLSETPFASDHFNWSWALPSLSIIAQTLRDHPVRAFVVDDPRPVFQPFDPSLEKQWPALEKYGVRYASRRR